MKKIIAKNYTLQHLYSYLLSKIILPILIGIGLISIVACEAPKTAASSATPASTVTQTYLVKFVTNVNGLTVNEQTVTKGSRVNEPTGLVRVGYTLDGWYTDKDTFNNKYVFTLPVNADLILYAKWTQQQQQLVVSAESYSGAAFLGMAIKDNTVPLLIADTDPVITIRGVENGANTWSFGTINGTKTATNNSFTITKADLAGATFTNNDKLILTTGGVSKELASYKPFEIRHWKDLQAMRMDLTGTYTLMNDLTFPDPIANTNFPTTGFVPIGTAGSPFSGSFNGNLNKITSFNINNNALDNVGLFGTVANSTKAVEIKNLIFVNAKITGKDNVGALSGYAENANITGIALTGNSTIRGSNYLGGIVGHIKNNTTIQGYSTGTISGSQNLGGLAGYVDSDNTIQGYSTAALTATSGIVGGLVGRANSANKIYGYSTGDISSDASVIAGGLVAHVNSSNNSIQGYFKGTITSAGYAGGLVGVFWYDIATSNARGYNRGTIKVYSKATNDNFGLIIGSNKDNATPQNTRTDTNIDAYVSSKSGESAFNNIDGNKSTTNNGFNGVTITVGTTDGTYNTQGYFDATVTTNGVKGKLSFGDKAGQWTWAGAGNWPGINLGFETGFSELPDTKDLAGEQPVSP